MKGMRKISISFLDAGIIQWQLKQLHEIKIWNILLRGHNFRVYCSVSGEGWRLPLLQTRSRERFSFYLQPASPVFFDTVCISSCWNIANFYCQFLAREWRLCTIAPSFYAISSKRGFKKHIKSTAVGSSAIVTISAIPNFSAGHF